MTTLRRLALLGATGSIGESTLDVAARHPDRFAVVALAAPSQLGKVGAPVPSFPAGGGRAAGRGCGACARRRALAGTRNTDACARRHRGLIEVATLASADTVLAAIVGAAGFAPTLAAARAGKRILLANKESAGHRRRAVHGSGRRRRRDARSDRQRAQRDLSMPSRALSPLAAGRRHPADPADRIGRAVSHSCAGGFGPRDAGRGVRASELEDGAQDLGRFGYDDEQGTRSDRGALAVRRAARRDRSRRASAKRHPFAGRIHRRLRARANSAIRTCAHRSRRRCAAPDRIDAGVPQLDLAALAALSFEAPDFARFPCLELAYAALAAGGSAPIALNAANEIAVAAFLSGRARFTDIAATCAATLARAPAHGIASFDDALAADADARRAACEHLALPFDAAITFSLAA